MKKFKEIKDLTAHQNPSPSYQELFHMMSDFMLDRIDPIRKAQRIARREERKTEDAKVELQPAEVQHKVQCQAQNLPETPSRHCSAQTERTVWVRAQSRCEHVDEKTRRRCEETRRLELDHVIPYAISQDSSEKNIELVCTAHNLYRATQWFGDEYMKQKKMGTTHSNV